MENAVLERVVQIQRAKSKSVREFAQQIGIRQNTLNQQFTGDRNVSLSTIQSIISTFEDISAEWLLRGEGEMLRTKESTTSDTMSHMADNSATLMALQAQKELIEMQREKIAELTKLLDDNKKISAST